MKNKKPTIQDIIVLIERRLDYGKEFRLKNKECLRSGWNSAESGECCDECLMDSSESNPLRVLASCRNPFQIESVCECHMSFRKVSEEAIQAELENLLWYLKVRPDLLSSK